MARPKWYEEQWRLDWAATSGWLDRGLMPSKTPIKPYVYFDADGHPVYKKTRWDLIDLRTGQAVDKTFTTAHVCCEMCEHADVKMGRWYTGIGPYGGPDSILLFQLQALLYMRLRKGWLMWNEGEKDARNVQNAHWFPAISHHQGSGGAVYSQAMWFYGARCGVLLGMDRDVVGRQIAWHHFELLTEVGLSNEQVKFVLPAVRRKKSDITNHMEEGYQRGELVRVSEQRMRAYIEEHGRLSDNPARRGGRWGSDKSKDA